MDRSEPPGRDRRQLRRLHDQLGHHADAAIQSRGLSRQRQQPDQLLFDFALSGSDPCGVRRLSLGQLRRALAMVAPSLRPAGADAYDVHSRRV